MNRPNLISIVKCVSFLLVALMSFNVQAQTCATGKVDDQVADFLKKAGPGQTMAQLKAASMQQLKSDVADGFIKLPKDSVKRIEITKGNIKVNVVTAGAKGKLPVIINFHQGGFIQPLLPSMEYEAMRLAKRFKAVVFDVDYRVAPEHKFPAAIDDAYSAYLWVTEKAGDYGGDPSKIILTGIDAGANLAALVMHKAKKEGKLKGLKCVIMVCPSVDNPMVGYYDSYDDYAAGYIYTKDQSQFNAQNYHDKSQWFANNADAWPIYEKEVAGLPPSLIITTEFDVLRDEGIAYGKRLEAAGNDVSIKCFPHQLHNFMGLPKSSGEMNRVYELMGEVITKGLAK